MNDNDIAFTALYARYYIPVRSKVYGMTKNWELAEDITQQSFINMWKAWDKWEEKGVPRSSALFRTAHNLTVDYFRKKGEKNVKLEDEHDRGEDNWELVATTLDFEEWVKGMGNIDRKLLAMIGDGRGYKETASLLGLSFNKMRMRLHVLRDEMKKDGVVIR